MAKQRVAVGPDPAQFGLRKGTAVRLGTAARKGDRVYWQSKQNNAKHCATVVSVDDPALLLVKTKQGTEYRIGRYACVVKKR